MTGVAIAFIECPLALWLCSGPLDISAFDQPRSISGCGYRIECYVSQFFLSTLAVRYALLDKALDHAPNGWQALR
ncbi:hypothetical protein ALO44_200154 [Pseudomonas syringae pv. tagetis]|uniref:Uncharacterized protein n=1 Tax=Pseudomonas syringae pv. tagetis TaxID=129140 RepID=A0A0Q0H5A3_9PSED|nr:hypothetical protein ALO44_200154 [Pseudomonas syringae pv. tagetis]